VEAALATLKAEGFAGTTARAIAARAGMNQALVFYHYGGVNPLLLAALDASSEQRLTRYREALASAETPHELVAAARDLFREDVEGGHVTVVTELIGASLSEPELRADVLARMQPWLELTREVLQRAVGGSPLAGLVPVAEVSSAFVALYLGLNLLSRLDPDRSQAEALFELLERAAALSTPNG